MPARSCQERAGPLAAATEVIFHAEALTRKRVDHWKWRDTVFGGRDELLIAALCLFLLAALVPTGGLTGSLAFAESLVEWPLETFEEPSAVVYHPPRKTLFVVGDQGDVAEVDLDGNILNRRAIGGDLEGITCDPATGKLYVVREGHEIVLNFTLGDKKADTHIGKSYHEIPRPIKYLLGNYVITTIGLVIRKGR